MIFSTRFWLNDYFNRGAKFYGTHVVAPKSVHNVMPWNASLQDAKNVKNIAINVLSTSLKIAEIFHSFVYLYCNSLGKILLV